MYYSIYSLSICRIFIVCDYPIQLQETADHLRDVVQAILNAID